MSSVNFLGLRKTFLQLFSKSIKYFSVSFDALSAQCMFTDKTLHSLCTLLLGTKCRFSIKTITGKKIVYYGYNLTKIERNVFDFLEDFRNF